MSGRFKALGPVPVVHECGHVELRRTSLRTDAEREAGHLVSESPCSQCHAQGRRVVEHYASVSEALAASRPDCGPNVPCCAGNDEQDACTPDCACLGNHHPPCHDCGRPIYLDKVTDDFRHLTEPERGCFSIRPERADGSFVEGTWESAR